MEGSKAGAAVGCLQWAAALGTRNILAKKQGSRGGMNRKTPVALNPTNTSSRGEEDSGSTTSNGGSMEKLKQPRINKGKEMYENKDNQDLFHSFFGKTDKNRG